jgi:hypothetical protein
MIIHNGRSPSEPEGQKSALETSGKHRRAGERR